MTSNRPGVVVERSDAARGGAVVLRTDIAGFVGIAQRGPIAVPVPVESQRQFSAHFGGFIDAGYLAYAVRGFFDNGGRRAWIVRAASRDSVGGARCASVTVLDEANQPAVLLSASSPGSWGNGLSLTIVPHGQHVAEAELARTTPTCLGVRSAAGFAAGDLVQIVQPGLPPAMRVLALVDGERRRLHLVHPDPARRGARDLALTGLDGSRPLRVTRIAYAVIVRERNQVIASVGDLHLVPEHPRAIARVFAAPTYDARDTSTLPRAPAAIVATTLSVIGGPMPRPLAIIGTPPFDLDGGSDGLALLRADDFIGEIASPRDNDIARADKARGLAALAPIDEIALLAMPDVLIRPDPLRDYAPLPQPSRDPCVACPPAPEALQLLQPQAIGEWPPSFDEDTVARLQSALLQQAEDAGDRFAVLGLPWSLATQAHRARREIIAWRERFDSRCAALYAPWLRVRDPRPGATLRDVPACGHVLGAIARCDDAHGVFRSPGNLPLSGVVATIRDFTDDDHGELNAAHVNALRKTFGREAVVGGARTLGNDPQWRYIGIVRLMLALKKAIALALRFVVFEPNDEMLRNTVASTIAALLRQLWTRGALAGERPEEAFFVRCDDDTTPASARDGGQLVALVGVAPAAPCEFIVLRVGREHNTLAVTFAGGDGLAA